MYQLSLSSYFSHYPEAPGHRRVDTSMEAAKAIKPDASYLRGACLEMLEKYGPLTADECAVLVGESILAIRPRFSELHKLGTIEDSGKRHANKSGKRAIVWRLKPTDERKV